MPPPNRLQALLELSRALSSSLDLRDVLLELLDRVARLTGATGTAVSRWDRERDVVVTLVHHSHAANSLVEEGIEGYLLSHYPATADVLLTQRPRQIRVSNPRHDPIERDMLRKLGFGSLLMLALVVRGESIGLLEIADVHDRSFSPQDVEFCQAVCDVVATSIHNAMLYERARDLAMRDQLTELHNRRSFDDRLVEAVARAKREREPLGLLVLDVDGLKRINDAGGHTAGDDALRMAADALRGAVRQGDTVCRLGGDEFAVILPGAGMEAAMEVAHRAQAALSRAGGGRFSFSGGVAIGFATASPQELYRIADRAAYTAKQEGGGRTLAA
jgi:diguanylate cyclase (GGDEF)-like protein